MYVQLLAAKQLDIDGRAKMYYPGDWVDLGKGAALRMLDLGEARVVLPVKFDNAAGCGIIFTANGDKATKALLRVGIDIPIMDMAGHLKEISGFKKALLWDGSYPLRLDLLAIGFNFLDKWEIAAPLWSYDQLAADIGTEKERAKTKSIIRDLRVPVYDDRLVFMRDCPAAMEVLDRWQNERPQGDSKLAFLRALYVVKPLLLALPTTWAKEKTR